MKRLAIAALIVVAAIGCAPAQTVDRDKLSHFDAAVRAACADVVGVDMNRVVMFASKANAACRQSAATAAAAFNPATVSLAPPPGDLEKVVKVLVGKGVIAPADLPPELKVRVEGMN